MPDPIIERDLVFLFDCGRELSATVREGRDTMQDTSDAFVITVIHEDGTRRTVTAYRDKLYAVECTVRTVQPTPEQEVAAMVDSILEL